MNKSKEISFVAITDEEDEVPSLAELRGSWKKAMKGKTTEQIMKKIDEGWDT